MHALTANQCPACGSNIFKKDESDFLEEIGIHLESLSSLSHVSEITLKNIQFFIFENTSNGFIRDYLNKLLEVKTFSSTTNDLVKEENVEEEILKEDDELILKKDAYEVPADEVDELLLIRKEVENELLGKSEDSDLDDKKRRLLALHRKNSEITSSKLSKLDINENDQISESKSFSKFKGISLLGNR
jgi:hypothetical protein